MKLIVKRGLASSVFEVASLFTFGYCCFQTIVALEVGDWPNWFSGFVTIVLTATSRYMNWFKQLYFGMWCLNVAYMEIAFGTSRFKVVDSLSGKPIDPLADQLVSVVHDNLWSVLVPIACWAAASLIEMFLALVREIQTN